MQADHDPSVRADADTSPSEWGGVGTPPPSAGEVPRHTRRRGQDATTTTTPHSTALDPLVHRLVGEIEERSLTREAVSLDAGLGKDTIGSWARGQRMPNIGNLRAALQVLGLAIDCMPIDGKPHPESSLSGIPCDSGETSQK